MLGVDESRIQVLANGVIHEQHHAVSRLARQQRAVSGARTLRLGAAGCRALEDHLRLTQHRQSYSQFAYTHSVGDYVSIDKTRTAALAEAGQLILAGLSGKLRITPQLFGLTFSRSPHPLFSDTYKFAARINRRMADNMECCIVR